MIPSLIQKINCHKQEPSPFPFHRPLPTSLAITSFSFPLLPAQYVDSLLTKVYTGKGLRYRALRSSSSIPCEPLDQEPQACPSQRLSSTRSLSKRFLETFAGSLRASRKRKSHAREAPKAIVPGDFLLPVQSKAPSPSSLLSLSSFPRS